MKTSTYHPHASILEGMTVRNLRKLGYSAIKDGKLSSTTSEIAHMRKDKLIETLKNGEIGAKVSTPSEHVPSTNPSKSDDAKPDAKPDEKLADAIAFLNALQDGLNGDGDADSLPDGSPIPEDKLPKGTISHPLLDRIVRKARRHKNVMLVGPAGTGKTTLAQQVAQVIDKDFGHISCSAGMSEAQVLGRMTMDGSYIGTQFIDIAKNGGLYLADEFDASDSNMLVVWNSFLANGVLSVPNNREQPSLDRHEDCYFLACCNTYGTSGSWEYTGRNQLDIATLDRFALSTVYVDYDPRLEEYLLTGKMKRKTNMRFDTHDGSKSSVSINLSALNKALIHLRKNVVKANIRRVVSTRVFSEGRKAILDGDTASQVLDDVTVSWEENEKDKALLIEIKKDVQTATNPQV